MPIRIFISSPGDVTEEREKARLVIEHLQRWYGDRLTLQPVLRYGVDAAVLYSDIVVPVAAIGFGVDVAPGTGPVGADTAGCPAPAGSRRLAHRPRLRRRRGRGGDPPGPDPGAPAPCTRGGSSGSFSRGLRGLQKRAVASSAF